MAQGTVVSLATSVIFTLGMSIPFGGGGTYLPGVEWDRIDKMSYRDATIYLSERTRNLSGWEAFVQGVQHPRYWIDLFQNLVLHVRLCARILHSAAVVARSDSYAI